MRFAKSLSTRFVRISSSWIPSRAPAPRRGGSLKDREDGLAAEAQSEIAAQTLGVKASVSTPTWVDHAYSCRYGYPDGEFVLSVKELSELGPDPGLLRLARAASWARRGTSRTSARGHSRPTNGSVVVRKDWKVLLVDITGLPPQFGVPPTSSGDVAVTVADVILGCWAGD